LILTEFTYEKLRSAKGKITLPVHEISILIGQNGGGKTTTLDALNLFFKIKMTIRNEDINSSLRAENPEVVFSGKFQITDEEKEFFNTFDSNLEGDYITIYKKFDLPNDESELDDIGNSIAKNLVAREFSDFLKTVASVVCKTTETTLDKLVETVDKAYTDLWNNGYEPDQLYIPYLLNNEIRK